MAQIEVKRLRVAKANADIRKSMKSPFGYACLKGAERIPVALKKFTEEFSDKQHELAMLNEDKSYKKNEKGQLVFTKENQDKLDKLWEEQNNKLVEYAPYFATSIDDVKEDLLLLDVMNGIIVDVDIEAMYLCKHKEPASELKAVSQNN